MTKEELKKRTNTFALRVFKFLMAFEYSKPVSVVSNQLFRAASSVAANDRSACRGKSNADFLNKLKIVDEEADESLFWLEFIRDLEIKSDKKELDILIKEANELVSIFSAAIRTIKSKNSQSSQSLKAVES
ncbi:MAG: four helix bundle protein [Bacteroidetes bacterium]|nr:four helix bundle protein [Bacteroidota bacterium]